MTETYIQMVMALAGVVGVIFVIGLFLKKRQVKPGLMNVVAYQSFGPRKGIAAVKIGREILVVGLTSTDIKLLKTFAENEFEEGTVRVMQDTLNKLKDIREELNERK